MTTGNEADDDRLLSELRAALLRRGMVTGDPGEGCPVGFDCLLGFYCELGLRCTGEVTWTCVPEGEGPGPAWGVRMALALLAPGAAPPQREPAPQDEAGRMTAAVRVLAAAGMTAVLADEDLGDGEATPVLRVANPARPARGQVRVIDGRELVWAFRIVSAGRTARGLSAEGAAGAVAAALAAAAGDAR